jgi:phosphohistidine phosphatase SixA
MKPYLAILRLALLLCLTGCALDRSGGPSTTQTSKSASPAQATFVNAHAIIIVRHADIDVAKKATMGGATPLLERGEARAKELVTALKKAGITRIVTSSAVRTQETAAPLAAELKLKEEQPFAHGAERGMPQVSEAKTVFDFLAETAKPDQTILLVHHHSVIPSLLAEFGFPNEPEFVDAAEFDRVYVLLPDAEHKTYQLLRLRYGGKWE